LQLPARPRRPPASRSRPVHAGRADDRARLHRVLHALHRQPRDPRGHGPAAQVQGRHVSGAARRRRGAGRAIPDLDLGDLGPTPRLRRPRHPRHDPPAPVRQGRDGAHRAAGRQHGRAGGDDPARRGHLAEAQ
ncbi:hypothetical protein OY671_011859, partial [Metschnikowia pulcherrima]